MSISPARAAACIRRLLLSWLIAALVQALASGGRQSLSGLAGLEAMSAPGLAAVTVAVFVLLSCLARRFSTARWERWAIAAVFALLSMIFPVYLAVFSGLPGGGGGSGGLRLEGGRPSARPLASPRGQIPAGGGCCRCNGHCLLPLCHRLDGVQGTVLRRPFL